MDYEQKYKNALKRAKKLYEKGTITESIGYIFPELKESEDERIRKAILIYLDWLDGRKDYAPRGEYSIGEMINWLVKQGKNHTWTEEDEIGYNDTMFAIEKARLVAEDEYDMGNLWYAERWLKSLKGNKSEEGGE